MRLSAIPAQKVNHMDGFFRIVVEERRIGGALTVLLGHAQRHPTPRKQVFGLLVEGRKPAIECDH